MVIRMNDDVQMILVMRLRLLLFFFFYKTTINICGLNMRQNSAGEIPTYSRANYRVRVQFVCVCRAVASRVRTTHHRFVRPFCFV